MSTALIATLGWTALAVALLLRAERNNDPRGLWIWKPLASLGFIACAHAAGALDTDYGQTVLAGLLLCALGDVLLIPRGAGAAFLAGMSSFALGHAAYALAFAQLGADRRAVPATLSVMVLIAVQTLRWLRPGLPAAMQWPIRIYISVISIMVALAVGASVRTGHWLVAAGAVLFAASDLSVARERFVRAAFINVLWGLPLYYAAQLLLALSVRR